ncbi:MAG: hypothetical protein MR908_10270 [Firmicutes bacterium]|nr:hypothetical protein [Bacillota bacterium]
MQGNSKKKMGSLIAAVVIIVLVAILIVAFVLLINGEENAGANGILWAYIAVLGAVIIGVLISLWQRFKEISKGEEEEAKKY